MRQENQLRLLQSSANVVNFEHVAACWESSANMLQSINQLINQSMIYNLTLNKKLICLQLF